MRIDLWESFLKAWARPDRPPAPITREAVADFQAHVKTFADLIACQLRDVTPAGEAITPERVKEAVGRVLDDLGRRGVVLAEEAEPTPKRKGKK